MSPRLDSEPVEEQIRRALNEIADRVTLADDLAIDASPVGRHRGAGHKAAVAALVAASVVAVTAGIGLGVRPRSGHVSSGPSGLATSSSTLPATTSSTSAPTDPVAAAVLAAWASFPVAANPRPLILLDGAINGPDGGFATDADKEAFGAGAITTPSALPSGPPTADGYSIISAAAALANFRSAGTGTASTVLTTTSVVLGHGTFQTDRGYLDLPAWLISFNGVTNPAPVLAVDPAVLFTPPDPAAAPAQIGASSTSDPRTLILNFTGAGAGSGPCGAEYTAQVTESDAAVAVTITETPGETTGQSSPTACLAIGYSRHVTITLTSPLGARVLVDEKTTSAIAVSH